MNCLDIYPFGAKSRMNPSTSLTLLPIRSKLFENRKNLFERRNLNRAE